ncbi:MAG: hypothetical protein KAH18_11170 [Psychromonas sp.]|nr:hypothetical protein [Psychromonas sp.]
MPKRNYETVEIKKRKIIDIEANTFITEYQSDAPINTETGKKHSDDLPDSAPKTVRYGDKFKRHIVYMSQYQLLPYHRVNSFFLAKWASLFRYRN